MRHAITLIALMNLSACGGGTVSVVGNNSDAPLSSAPGEAAIVKYLQEAHQYTLNATDGTGNRFTIQFSSQPNTATATFDGEAGAHSTTETLTVEENGTAIATSISTSYYFLNPYVPLGKSFSTGNPYGVVTSSTPLPATFNVGTTGSVDNLTYYHDPTMAVIDANETGTYSVEAYNSAVLRMCLSFAVSDVTLVGTADDLAPDTEIDCYTVDASGTAALLSISLTVGIGETLTFQ